jgi:hypothetical protein
MTKIQTLMLVGPKMDAHAPRIELGAWHCECEILSLSNARAIFRSLLSSVAKMRGFMAAIAVVNRGCWGA